MIAEGTASAAGGDQAKAIVVLLAILVFSYRQVIEAYPDGGGCYAVSRANLAIRYRGWLPATGAVCRKASATTSGNRP